MMQSGQETKQKHYKTNCCKNKLIGSSLFALVASHHSG